MLPSYDPTGNRTIKAYVNGVEITGWDVSHAPLVILSINLNPDLRLITVGRDNNEFNAGDATFSNGYLSDDFYFVDGQALEPYSIRRRV